MRSSPDGRRVGSDGILVGAGPRDGSLLGGDPAMDGRLLGGEREWDGRLPLTVHLRSGGLPFDKDGRLVGCPEAPPMRGPNFLAASSVMVDLT